MNDNLWIKDPASHEGSMTIADPDGWFKAQVRWDGCVHLNIASNTPFTEPDRRTDCDDYIHICELDDMITRLQSIKTIAIEHFGEWWPG